MLKDARQGEVHEADDIAQITDELPVCQVFPERQSGEDRAEDKGGERDLDGERWDQPKRTKCDKLVWAGSREAARDEKPRQREEHRQNGCDEEAKRPAPRGSVQGGRPWNEDVAVPNEHGERQSNPNIVKSGREAAPFFHLAQDRWVFVQGRLLPETGVRQRVDRSLMPGHVAAG